MYFELFKPPKRADTIVRYCHKKIIHIFLLGVSFSLRNPSIRVRNKKRVR